MDNADAKPADQSNGASGLGEPPPPATSEELARNVEGLQQQVKLLATNVEGLNQKSGERERNVEELNTRIEKETTGLARTVKWAGLIVALLVGMVTMPKGIKDSYESYFARPYTTITPESSLLMTYDPQTRLVGFGFGFTIANDGKKKDTIQSLSARLMRIDRNPASDLLTLGDSNFAFTEKSIKVPNHFSVTESTPRELDGSVKAYLNEQFKSDFLLPKSRWRLDVVLIGAYGQRNSMKYCFDISKDDIDEIFGSGKLVESSIKNPNCEGNSRKEDL